MIFDRTYQDVDFVVDASKMKQQEQWNQCSQDFFQPSEISTVTMFWGFWGFWGSSSFAFYVTPFPLQVNPKSKGKVLLQIFFLYSCTRLLRLI